MAFAVEFYEMTSEKTSVSKPEITGDDAKPVLTVSAILKDGSSIIDPVLRVATSDMSQFRDTNYCRIAQFNRFYFIQNISYLNGNIVEIACHVDVLTTYRKDIRQSMQLVSRQEHKRDKMLVDSNYVVGADRSYQWGSAKNLLINTGDGGIWRGGTYILKTVGGV